MVEPSGEPNPARSPGIVGGEGDGRVDGRAVLGRLAERAGEAALTAVVRGRSDEQLHRLFDRGPGLPVMFKGMERAFRPEEARGYEGAVQYDLRLREGVRSFAVTIGDGRARAREGVADTPAVTLRMGVPAFVRLAAGEAYPPKLLVEGELEVAGDINVAARLGEMFGGPVTS